MPQFDLATFLPQVFWLVICFTSLYVFTVGYSVPRFKKAYDERWQHTQGTRIEATKIHREAQDITAKYEKELEDIRKQASHLMSTRLREISQATTDEKNKILEDIKKRYTKGELFLSERKMNAFVQAQSLEQMLATEIIMKLIRDRMPAETVKTKVAQSFKERQ
jgi:F-type H+-transporting ATPase subunit b